MEGVEMELKALDVLKSTGTLCIDAFLKKLCMLCPGFCWTLLQVDKRSKGSLAGNHPSSQYNDIFVPAV